MSETLIIGTIQTVILLGGFIVAIRQMILLEKQVKLMTMQMQEQLDWQRKNVTFNYLGKFSQCLRKIDVKLQKDLRLLIQDGGTIEVDEMYRMLDDPKVKMDLYEIVSYYEHMAIGIKAGYFDETVCKEAKLNAVISTFKSLKPYILLRRNQTNREIGGNFERLAKKWEKEV